MKEKPRDIKEADEIARIIGAIIVSTKKQQVDFA